MLQHEQNNVEGALSRFSNLQMEIDYGAELMITRPEDHSKVNLVN